ncbi:MAG: DUF4321 domain-containing protein [Candidatus Krumholzibacteriia bacterium]|nr:DUF4321 domain-containing protein [bacterium]MCB9514927.1 DUF4321 domain-containing protein [Candidatus Latescibacterota bacterium]
MSLHRKSFKTIVLAILLGIAVGTLLGDLLGIVLPDGIPRDVLTYSRSFTLEPFTVNLLVVSFTLGFSLTFNLLSVLGIFVMIQLLKWAW